MNLWVGDVVPRCDECGNELEESCEDANEDVTVCLYRCRCCADSECIARMMQSCGL